MKSKLLGAVFWLVGGWMLLCGTAGHAVVRDGVVLAFREVRVSSTVAGNLSSVEVKEGDTVMAGETLAGIEATQQELEVERQERILAKRKFDYEGLENLLKENMTSRDEALQAQIEMEIAELDYERAVFERSRRTLKAPMAGLVAGVHLEAGEWVEPGTVVVEILDIDRVFAQLLLRAEEAGTLELGMPVPLRFASLGELEVEGTIDFIDPRVDPASGLQRVKVLVDNPEHRIRPGLRCFAQIGEATER